MRDWIVNHYVIVASTRLFRRLLMVVLLLLAAAAAARPGEPAVTLVGSDTPVPGALGAEDIQKYYGLSAADLQRGARSRIYIIDSFDSQFQNDLVKYRTEYNLSQCTTDTGCLQIVEDDGVPTGPGDYEPPSAPGTHNHGNLVAEVVSAICQRCAITAIRTIRQTRKSVGAALVTARALGAKFVNLSVGGPLLSGPGTEEKWDYSLWGSQVTQGRSAIFYGAAASNTPYRPEDDPARSVWPKSSPLTTNVGGVTEQKTVHPSRKSTCFSFRKVPEFQKGVSSLACAGRATNDLSGLSDNISVFSTNPARSDLPDYAKWQAREGASFAAPAITALAALNNAPRPDQDVNTYLYDNAVAALKSGSGLDDVTSGHNWAKAGDVVGGWVSTGDCGTIVCNGAVGWDGPSGWGVPQGPSILAPPEGGAGPATASELRVAPWLDSVPGCLGIPLTVLSVKSTPVQAVSCDDPNAVTAWQTVPITVLTSSGSFVPGIKYVLEGPGNVRLGCLATAAGTSPTDGTTAVLGACDSSAAQFEMGGGGSLRNPQTGTYLTSPARLSSKNNTDVSFRTTKQTTFKVTPES